MNNLDNKKLVLLVLFFILLFLKVDYRFVNTIECCGDDFDYYMHAQTIATDFDLDYSNQLQEDQHIKYNGKIAPKGFIGSGLLSAPFYFLGDYIDGCKESLHCYYGAGYRKCKISSNKCHKTGCYFVNKVQVEEIVTSMDNFL